MVGAENDLRSGRSVVYSETFPISGRMRDGRVTRGSYWCPARAFPGLCARNLMRNCGESDGPGAWCLF